LPRGILFTHRVFEKMKFPARSISCFLVLLAVAHAEPPPVTLREALNIAQKNLAERGLDKKLYVAGVTLERASMFNGKSYWFVKWSDAIAASNPNNREIGIKVNMDGSAVRLIKEPH
jgi:hypothetical protein